MKISYQHIALFIALFGLLFISCKTETKQNGNALSKSDESKLTDDELLNLIQKQTIDYFWDGAEPNSGLARERLHMDDIYPTSPKNTVTTGGSGFGLMSILVGIERGFVDKDEAFDRFEKIVDFLDNADRFHGAWPHWLNGETGKTVPFSKKDNGGDLVETAFLVQGLLTVSEYYKNGDEQEQALVAKINKLWKWLGII